MSKRKKEDEIFLRKKTEEKQNSVNMMIKETKRQFFH